MCELFIGQPKENYMVRSRSIRILGHITSIRLENKYWTVLDEMSEI
ncbi:DNA-binding protein, partial [Vibrio parahaemolyticus]